MVPRKSRRDIVRTRSHPRLCSGAKALLHHRDPRLSSSSAAAAAAAAARAAKAAGSVAQQHRIQLSRLEVIVEAADGEQHRRGGFGCGREMLLRLKRMRRMMMMLDQRPEKKGGRQSCFLQELRAERKSERKRKCGT
ncbi:unnamed protein product [Pleuronectes platessa]|uniref:Uncharacterized protein n=1 Tax=Pleuronectes platessa TaxID=8262 RepID=A0A9N7TYS7_PLEPL|nr:unnamed protein product [Pleuronectes platessa]